MAQKIYPIDASKVSIEDRLSTINMGNPGPIGKEIFVNKKYLTKSGKPILPVMGELQFSRQPREQWEDKILKMKACGVNVVSTYLYWIHHEETEGKFDFSGNRDFRAFIQLCQKHEMFVFPRIGPWVNSEVRNGGTPDWIFAKMIPDRSMDTRFLKYAERYLEKLCVQMEGLYYKDNGPIIGVQLENEYQKGKDGESYILWLKQTGFKYGIDVPLYSITGWGNVSVPGREVIPFYGDYSDYAWCGPEEVLNHSRQYHFSRMRNFDITTPANPPKDDPTVELINKQNNDFPYFSTEAGLGMFTAFNRRHFFPVQDGEGLLIRFLGSGCNLIGYYPFASGTNPIGIYNSMQGSVIPMPKISYDFNTAITESGELQPSYFGIKKVHYFLNEFGDRLAPMETIVGESSDSLDIQFSVRANENSAFLFGMNYMRNETRATRKDVQFSVKLKNETIVFPSKPISIADSSIFIWPINLNMDGVLLKYATAQPLSKLVRQEDDCWVFVQNSKIQPEFCFNSIGISAINSTSGTLKKLEGRYVISNIKSGYDSRITIITNQNKRQTILVLNEKEASQSWILKDGNNKKHLYLFGGHMYINNGKLELFNCSNKFSIKEIKEDGSVNFTTGGKLVNAKVGLWDQYNYSLPSKDLTVECNKLSVLSKAAWLKIPSQTRTENMVIFSKTFNLSNLSPIDSSRLIVEAECSFNLSINGKQYPQKMITGKHSLDVTNYLQKGENVIAFHFSSGKSCSAFAAFLNIDYKNTNRDQIDTDSSWQIEEGKSVDLIPDKTKATTVLGEPSLYQVKVPGNFREGINTAYLHINYSGDRAFLYDGNKAIEDNANNNTAWSVNLNQHLTTSNRNTLELQIHPFKKDFKVYFDRFPDKKYMGKGDKNLNHTYVPDGTGKAEIIRIKVVPEYKLTLTNK